MPKGQPVQTEPGQYFPALFSRFAPEPEAAADVYERTRRELIAFFRRRNVTTPEDIADEVFERAGRRIAEGKDVRDVVKYCFGVARTYFLEHCHKQQSHGYVPLDDWRLISRPNQEVEQELRAREQVFERLQACLAQLSGQERVLVMEYHSFDADTKREGRKAIAHRLGITPNCLHVRVHRVMCMLREMMQVDSREV